MRSRRWVILNYPVVTSRGTDNSGGFAHLVGNIQVYRALGLEILCLCRFCWPLVDRLDGALCLNIVPGAALPHQHSAGPTAAAPAGSGIARRLRDTMMQVLLDFLVLLLRPRLLHERANLRFMARRRGNFIHLIELNDAFVPKQPCDGYLTVHERQGLNAPQFPAPWPVPETSAFNRDGFLARLRNLQHGRGTVLLFGAGGIANFRAASDFLGQHPWFRGAKPVLHVYGATGQDEEGLVFHGWQDESGIDASIFNVGLLYYEPSVYDDARLTLGSPTKLSKYYDWSLPVLSNRAVISDRFLGGFDRDRSVLECPENASRFADLLTATRNRTSIAAYASQLADFLGRHGLHL
jgi:hypothetical protein